MAKREPKSLFRRLTRLFRSGPIVKRKIRALDTTIAVADKTKSSGTLLFQKSLSPTYATITSNAYNLSERLMRYQDFQEMEYSVAISTLIATPDGFKTIGELAEACASNPDHTFIVYSYDHNLGRIVPAFGKQARQTCVDHAWKVTFDNGKTITANPEHRLMLRDGSYRRVEDLQPGDAMMPFYRKDLFVGAEEGTKGYSWVYTMDDRFRGWTKEHQLVAEWVAGRQLTEDECVHHINFVKTDNRPENLRIMTKSDHNSYHAAINNGAKWGPENHEWVEEFKKNHAAWMRDNAPTARRDVTFARILETAERVGFSMPAIALALDVTWNLIYERLVAHGFATFDGFVKAYAGGQIFANLPEGRPGLLTRDLSLELLRSNMTSEDTKRSLCIKLGCTVNVLDKFLARRAQTSWSELRSSLGYSDGSVTVSHVKSVRKGGRPRGANGNDLTFQQICDAYEPKLTMPRLAEKLDVNKNTVISRLAQNGFKRFSDFQATYDNCKVVSVEYVGEMPLYDLTVDGYKNFATDSVVSHNTPEIAAALDIYADETCAQDEKGRIIHVYSDNEKIREVLEDLFYNILNVEFQMRSWARNLPVRKDSVIPLLDGRNITIEQLAREHEKGKENWVYSVQDGTHRMVPGKVSWCGLTRKDSELVRVWLDDGTYVDCTPDHEWVMRDGQHKRADQLVHGESLMPLYRQAAMMGGKKGYERVYDPESMQYRYTHRLMVQHRWTKADVGKVVHHVNCNRSDNTPTNLKVMTQVDHIDLHRKMASSYNSSPKHKLDNVQRSAVMKKMWADPAKKQLAKENMAIKFDQRCVDMVVERLAAHGKYVSPKVLGDQLKSDDVFMGHLKAINEGTKRDLTKSFNSHTGFEALLQKAGVGSYLDLVRDRLPAIASTPWFHRAEKKSAKMTGVVPAMRNAHPSVKATYKNHKVDRVERLAETDDAYCMEVLGPNGEHDRHRFGIMCYTGDGQVSKSSIISTNCKYGDFFLYNDVSPEYGVVNAFPIPVNEIEREENYDRDDPFAVRYRWVTLGNRTLENWEVTHFRLLGNDMFLPYGSSIIEPARRIWRQLILIEDAMLVYRVVRAPERRVFYIDVANVPPSEVPQYIEQQRQQLHTAPVIDRQTGRVDVRYNPMSVEEDYYIAVRGGESGTKIDTLKGGENTASVEDVAYIQKKLFAALKIPRAYLGYDEMLSSKATLAQEDIRFSRTINVIQKTMMAELNKMAIIHLFAHGYDNEDLQNFTLRLSNPSTVAQQQKLELWRAKFEIAGTSPEGLVDKQFIRKEIMGLNEEQIKEIDDRRMAEKKVDAAIEAVGGEAAGGAAGGGEDLFGGGGGEELGGGEAGGEAPPPEENAGEEPEEKDDGLQLITGGDDAADDESFSLKLGEIDADEKPVKPQSQLDRYLYNNGRRRTHGASKTHMPDFNKMTKLTAKDGHSTEDPYDGDWFRSVVSDPLGEGTRHTWRSPNMKLPPDIVSAIRHMTEAWGRAREKQEIEQGTVNVLSEGKDVQEEIDRSGYDYLNIDLSETSHDSDDLLTEGGLDIDEDSSYDEEDEDDE